MEERGNQAIMCSVFFLGIVEYAKKSVTEQIMLKDRFNSYLSVAIRDVPITDRIIMDTSDGVAINFLGDVEDALKTALSLRESLFNESADADQPLLVRMGINLGPVRLIRDSNGQPNIVGDGINVAQKVMSFADVGQVLVSRSYYDAISRLSPQYAGMFHYQGSRTDTNVREHEVYAIGYSGDKSMQRSEINTGHSEHEESQFTRTVERAKIAWDSIVKKLSATIEHLEISFWQAEPQQRAIYVGVAVVPLLLLIVLAVKLVNGDTAHITMGDNGKSAVSSARTVPVPVPVMPVQASSPVDKNKDIGKAQVPSGTKQQAVESKVAQSRAVPKPKLESKPETKLATKPEIKPKLKSDISEGQPKAITHEAITGKASVAVSNGSSNAYLSVSCREGTEIFVDGVRKGRISGSQLNIPILPGKHAVIVSHPKAGLFSQDVSIEAGKTVRLNPGFCN